MNVTEVRISPTNRGGKVRAFASIVIDDCFIVNDLRVVEGREGQMFVTMPARKARNGQLRDIAHPLNSETRQEIEKLVLAEFDQAVRSLVVPDRSRGSANEGDSQSMFDRLASKLFSEGFWIADPSPQEDDKQ
jgi:stage V sporulation protein G